MPPRMFAGLTSAQKMGMVEILIPIPDVHISHWGFRRAKGQLPKPMNKRQIKRPHQFCVNACARTGNTTLITVNIWSVAEQDQRPVGLTINLSERWLLDDL